MGTDVRAARERAGNAHGDQKYGDRPYLAHLDAVVEVLERFGYSHPDMLIAGYFHDALEDTDMTFAQLVQEYGRDVAVMVDAVTDGEGKNRKARKERPYRLIPKVPFSLALKLADRIANLESARATNPGLLKMYRKEQETFRERLYDHAYKSMFDHIEEVLG